MNEKEISKIQQNTLKMIRNNLKFENLIKNIVEILEKYPNKNNNLKICELISETVKILEEYEL